MKIFILTIIAIFGITTIAPAKAQETLNVRIGQTKTADHGKIKIKFISVLDDSRCPMNARCIWAGNAKIKIEVSKRRGVSKIVELNTGVEPKLVTVYGYELSLQDLTPQKGAPANWARRHKTATISVQKIGQ